MKPDISSRKDIHFIITQFYDKLLDDTKMLPFFEEIIHQNTLEHHLDVIADFWNDMLFQTTSYKNNTMQKHVDKHAFVQFKKVHFNLWLQYFNSTINDSFSGQIAKNMKNRANSIAMVMQLKMNLYSK